MLLMLGSAFASPNLHFTTFYPQSSYSQSPPFQGGFRGILDLTLHFTLKVPTLKVPLFKGDLGGT